MKLHWQILIALALAVVVGSFTHSINQVSGFDLTSIYEFFGAMFLNALKMIIVPLIVSSIIVGIASIEQDGSFARMGSKTLIYYVATSTIAITIGLFLVMVFQPGLIDDVPAKDVLGLHADTEKVTEKVGDAGAGDVAGIFLRMIPPNIIHAAAQGQMLGLIFFSLLFGYFIAQLKNELKQNMQNFFEGMFEVMMKITDLIMRFAPLGVFALVANIVASSGLEVFIPLAKFFFVVLAALATHMFIVMPILLRIVGRVKPGKHFSAMSPALLTAFSTSSSSATLPVTLDCVQDRAGVSNRTSSFVLPLGATINMDGTSLYQAVAAVFIMQVLWPEGLTFSNQLYIVLTALLASIGSAAVPGAGMVMLVIVLESINFPKDLYPVALALIFAVDRPLDMCRTVINVTGDATVSTVVAKSVGKLGEPNPKEWDDHYEEVK